MRLVAMLAVLAVLGLSGGANAQVIIGTQGTPSASLGYYSPYPGALYSPFRQPAVVPNGGFNTNRFYGGSFSNGYTITRFPGQPQYIPQPTPRGNFHYQPPHSMRRR